MTRTVGINIVLAVVLLMGFQAQGLVHADHELPKPPPLWSPLDDVEWLALIEVPMGWLRCRPARS